jgi:hypothetical protein
MGTKAFASARKFLVSRIVEQAALDGVSLADTETRMLGFSEASATPEELETAAEFERDFDDEQYESKIASLIRHAYVQDKNRGESAAWSSALDALIESEEDAYLLIMLDRAHIGFKRPGLFSFDKRVLLTLVPVAAMIGVAVLVAFTPWGARLVPNESARLAVYVLVLCILLLVWLRDQKRKE